MIMADSITTHSDGTLKQAGLSYRMRKTAHLTSDTSLGELLAFTDAMRLPRRWLHNDHFDISPAYRETAIRHGAVEVSTARLVCHRYSRRQRYVSRNKPHECICGECPGEV